MTKQVYSMHRVYFFNAEIVAESKEEAMKKFDEMWPNVDYVRSGFTEIGKVRSNPPKNKDNELICGRPVEDKNKGTRKCQNRVSAPFEACHHHQD